MSHSEWIGLIAVFLYLLAYRDIWVGWLRAPKSCPMDIRTLFLASIANLLWMIYGMRTASPAIVLFFSIAFAITALAFVKKKNKT